MSANAVADATPNVGEVLKGLSDQIANLTKSFGEISKTVEDLKKPVSNGQNLFAAVSGPLPKDSASYSFFNVIKAYRKNDWEQAKLENDIHEKMMAAGYACEEGRLVPLDPIDIENRSEVLKKMGLTEMVRLKGDQLDLNNIGQLFQKSYGMNPSQVTKTLSAFSTIGEGSALINPVLAGSVLELLRAALVINKAGAQEIPLPPSGVYRWARQTADPTFYWLGENNTITATDPNLGNVVFTAKKLAGLVILSNESLLFTNPGIETVVRLALAQGAARTEESAYFNALGTTYQPKGIVGYGSDLTVHTAATTGSNGDTFGVTDPLAMITKVEEANDPQGPTAFVMRPLMWNAIASRRADSITAGDQAGQFMFWNTRGDMDGVVPKNLHGVPVYTTTNISNTRVKGSGTNLTYILCANFRRAIIGRVSAGEISALSSGDEFKRDQTAMRFIMRTDFQLTHTKPFVLCDSLLVQ